MQKLVDDIKFALRDDQFFNPHHLAMTARLLGELDYKSTDLIPIFFQKVRLVLNVTAFLI